MGNAPTNVLSSASPHVTRLSEQTGAPGQPLQARPSQSERRPSAVENKYVKKILEFFERTAGRFQSWKESRKEAALRRSGRRAVSTITRGLATDDFKKVYQGLKRLHNAEQKLSNMGGTVGALDKESYIWDRLKIVVSECLSDEKFNDLENLRKFVKRPNEYVEGHSDSKTLFHRMLLGLERFGLISSSYVGSRKERIQTQDNKIKASLLKMKDELQSMQDGSQSTQNGSQSTQDGSQSMQDGLRSTQDGSQPTQDGLRSTQDRSQSMQDRSQEQNLISSLKKQAGDGSSHAMLELGECFRDGRGVDPNPEEAFRWFSQAADAGHPWALSAMYELGLRYRDGRGVDPNQKTAASLFREAADRGYYLAEVALDELAQKMRSAGTGID